MADLKGQALEDCFAGARVEAAAVVRNHRAGPLGVEIAAPFAQDRPEGNADRLQETAVERGAHVEPHEPRRRGLQCGAQTLFGLGDRTGLAAQDDLPGGVDVRDVHGKRADDAGDRLRGKIVRDDRGHRPDADGHRGLHEAAARLDDFQTGREGKRAGSDERREFAERVPPEQGGTKPVPGGESPQHGNFRRNETGLGILGQIEPCVVRKTDGGHIPPQGVRGFLKRRAAFRHLVEKILAHPLPLASLAGEDRCAYRFVCQP